jgi:hypothetical protein
LPAVLDLLMTAAEGGEEVSKTPFYVAGLALTAFAVIVSATGIRAHGHWPSSAGAARGVMALCAVLVAATLATAVITG